jgi:hypothetical protein
MEKPVRSSSHSKGQSILLTQAILFGFTIFLVYAISSTFVGIRDDYQKFIGENEIKYALCFSNDDDRGVC